MSQNTWATAPRQVSIALTNACDLRCEHCFAPKTRATLEFERVITWLDELDAHGTMGVGFGGGEPTLHPRFVDLCAYSTIHTGLAVTFTTHGHHLTDQLLGKLEGYVNFVRVSMDGVKTTYERIRGRPFAALVERLKAIRQITSFGINYVVNFDTLSDLSRAVRLAADVNASEFLLLPEQAANGRPGVSGEIMQRLREWVYRYSGEVPLSISESGADGMPTIDPFPTETGLREYVHVDAHGTVKHTSFHNTGIAITSAGVMSALRHLRHQTP